MDILAKCFYNQNMKQLADTIIEILKAEPSLCSTLLNMLLVEDKGEYLMQLLLECPDPTVRFNVAFLLKHILNTLKIQEKDFLY
jgi:hypothetical protein